MLIRCFQVMSLTKPLFYKDYSVKTLEIKGDYEIWANDMKEYFTVSGYPHSFWRIYSNEAPRPDAEEEPEEEKEPSAEAIKGHLPWLAQARYAIYRSLGDSIKREIAKQKYDVHNVNDLWLAVRYCFYLNDEATVQQIRDDIVRWDLDKAGSWDLYVEGIERLYQRLDTVAGSRSYNYSDKLHKLRQVLSKLDGEKERNIFNQVELLVDTSSKTPEDMYQQAFSFADKRMKLIDKPSATRQTAFNVTSKFCHYCKKNGHLISECLTKVRQSKITRPKTRDNPVECRSYNPQTGVCAWEQRNKGAKCNFLHKQQNVHLLEDNESADADAHSVPQPTFMITFAPEQKRCRSQPTAPAIQRQIYTTITRAKGTAIANNWVIDGAATINISNGVGAIPGSIRQHTTILEVVGKQKITCHEVADFSIEVYLPDGSRGANIELKNVPILHNIKYNLISESQLQASVIKTGRDCWIKSDDDQLLAVAKLAQEPRLFFLATTPDRARMVGRCPWTPVQPIPSLHQATPPVTPPPATPPPVAPLLCEPSQVDEELKEQGYTRANKYHVNTQIAQHTHTYNSQNMSKLQLWHERLGHLNFEATAKMLRIKPPRITPFCESCCLGKSTLYPAPSTAATRATRIAELIHSDMAGPIEVQTPSGKRYPLLFIDDFSRRIFLELLRHKDELTEEFITLDKTIEVETTHRIAFFRSDGEGSYKNKELDAYCRKRGIQRQFSTAYNQFQNGVSERTIRTLVEMTRTLLIHAGAPKNMWGEAICYATQILNRRPTSAVPGFPNPLSASSFFLSLR